jgi:hypothetical protein
MQDEDEEEGASGHAKAGLCSDGKSGSTTWTGFPPPLCSEKGLFSYKHQQPSLTYHHVVSRRCSLNPPLGGACSFGALW